MDQLGDRQQTLFKNFLFRAPGYQNVEQHVAQRDCIGLSSPVPRLAYGGMVIGK